MSTPARPILIGFGISLLVAVVVIILIHPVSRYQRVRCREQLKALGYAVQVYRSDQSHLPHQLCVLSSELINPVLLTCPGSRHTPGSFTNADSWADYTFVDWSVVFGTNTVPDNYPIAYDRFMSNHAGHGVNILTVNGFVKWDPNAEWLKKFATEHPDAKLPMPE
jgi:hypothetical protein